jgi:hypothetical protein
MAAATAHLGCSASPPATRSNVVPVVEPRWQDVFAGTPELVAIVRARAVREDRVYGPLFRRALELVREQSRAVAGVGPLDAMSDAEEIVVGVRVPAAQTSGDHDDGELVLVARGVRGDLDPAKLVDEDGRSLWALGPPGRVRELVREGDARGQAISASLFELGGRTWVIAQGAARQRARDAFAHPLGRPAPIDLDPQALAVVRIDGHSLVRRVHALQETGGLAALGRQLRSVTLVVPPGAERAVRVTFTYGDEDAASAAAVLANAAIGAVARSRREGFEWIGSAHVGQAGDAVVLTAPLPAQLVEALLHAASARPIDAELPR